MTGFNSKRQMAANKLQEPWNEDEWRRNNWRCGHGWLRGEQCEICNAPQLAQEPVNLLEARRIAAEYGMPDSQIDSGNLYFALMKCLEHIDAPPAQEPVSDRENAIIRFALRRFVVHAYTHLNEAGQDKNHRHYPLESMEKFWKDAADAEALLKRFQYTTPPLPVQEPVAWMCSAFDGEPCEQTNHDECGNPIPLYTTPPQRK